MAAPIRTTEPSAKLDDDLECTEDFNLPVKRQRYITVVNPPSTNVYLLRFNASDGRIAVTFCNFVLQKGLAIRAQYHTDGSGYWLVNGAISKTPQGGVVECEVLTSKFEKTQECIKDTFGGQVPVEIFRKA